jgi:hypothetical protein
MAFRQTKSINDAAYTRQTSPSDPTSSPSGLSTKIRHFGKARRLFKIRQDRVKSLRHVRVPHPSRTLRRVGFPGNPPLGNQFRSPVFRISPNAIASTHSLTNHRSRVPHPSRTLRRVGFHRNRPLGNLVIPSLEFDRATPPQKIIAALAPSQTKSAAHVTSLASCSNPRYKNRTHYTHFPCHTSPTPDSAPVARSQRLDPRQLFLHHSRCSYTFAT